YNDWGGSQQWSSSPRKRGPIITEPAGEKKVSARCPIETPRRMGPGSRFRLRSSSYGGQVAWPGRHREGMWQRALQHHMHVDHHAVGVTRSGGDENVLHQPAVFCSTGFEFRRGAEIDQFWIHRLAAFELLQQLDRPEADAPVLDIDHRAVVGLEGVFRFEIDQLVGADDLEVGAERQHLAVDPLAFHLAAGDRNDAADAMADIARDRHLADAGRDGEGESGVEL